jgi:four helix bundle protein
MIEESQLYNLPTPRLGIKQQPFDLENRTFKFTKEVIDFLKKVPKNFINNEILKQVIRSSGSVGANYIEANESLSKKDFIMRIKICRKEAKETVYWLKLLDLGTADNQTKCKSLFDEATQLTKIFSAIVARSK